MLQTAKQRIEEKFKHQKFFCGDCKRFRTKQCINVQLSKLAERGNNGNAYWLHYPQDLADDCEYYEEKETPEFRLQKQEEVKNESRKYGETVIWL